MDDMVRDMRNRFPVALVLSVPIMLFSPMGRDVPASTCAGAVRSARRRVQLPAEPAGGVLLAWMLRRRRGGRCAPDLDMMVLVAVAVGAGWLCTACNTAPGAGGVLQKPLVLTTFCAAGALV